MEIRYFGHSLFKLKGKKSTVITDPYDPDYVGLKYPKLDADIVTVSHDHRDHNFIERITQKFVIKNPGEYEVSEVSVMGFPTFHDNKSGSERGKNTVFVIELDDLRICHLGDLGHKLSDKDIENLGNVDILLVPVGGVYTINPQEASEIVRDIEPLLVIPMHFQCKGLNPAVFAKLSGVDEFLRESGIPVEKMDKLTVRKEDLAEEQKVILLSNTA